MADGTTNELIHDAWEAAGVAACMEEVRHVMLLIRGGGKVALFPPPLTIIPYMHA